MLLGNGDGTFQTAVTYDNLAGATLYGLTAADLNGAGRADVVVSTDEGLFVFVNNGDGTFGLLNGYAPGGRPGNGFECLAVADMNRDGIPDLVVRNAGTDGSFDHGSVGVLLGNDDGTFQKAVVTDSGGYFPNAMAVADVNGDGKPDVVLAETATESSAQGLATVLLGNGDGTFEAPMSFPTAGPNAAAWVAISDVNRDGKPDIVETSPCSDANCTSPNGVVGVLINITRFPVQPNEYQVLHSFYGQPAKNPSSALVADSKGNLYGVAGGGSGCAIGCGSVIMLARNSGGKWITTTIYQFSGLDGGRPMGSLIMDSSGNLYGTTEEGGANGVGVVFELSPSGSGWVEKVLHSFGGGSDVSCPMAALVMDPGGNLYGTASCKGILGAGGGVFELRRSGDEWIESVIFPFTGGNTSGGSSNLTLDAAGNLYGTTAASGSYNHGSVYRLTPSGSETWTKTVLYNFTGGADGVGPAYGVTFDSVGNLYGTTIQGGDAKTSGFTCGTVYELSPSSNSWTHKLLHTFTCFAATPVGVPVLGRL